MTWDKYFLGLCEAVSMNTKCLSRRFGAILVRDNCAISEGYNGPPRGVPHCGERYFKDDLVIKEMEERLGIVASDSPLLKLCPRYALGYKSGQGLHLCHAGHAERNAILCAARNGIATKGTKLYCNCGIPCGDCMIEIINAGIEEIIVTKMSFYDGKTKYLVDNSGIKIRTYSCLEEEE